MSDIREQHCPRNVSIAGTKYLTPTLQEPSRGERVNFSLQSFWITAHPCGEVKSKELGCSRHIHIQEESEMFACSLACLQPDSLPREWCRLQWTVLPIPVRQPSTATPTGQCKQSFPETRFQGDSGLYQVDRESYRRRYLARCSSFRLSDMFPHGACLVFVVLFFLVVPVEAMEYVSVFFPFKIAPPSFVEWPESLTRPRAGTARFVCQAEGTPSPKMSWLKNGRRIHSNGRIKMYNR